MGPATKPVAGQVAAVEEVSYTSVSKEIQDKIKAPKAKVEEKKAPVEKVSPEEQARRDEKTRVGMIAARRMRMCDFFAQAGWFDIASDIAGKIRSSVAVLLIAVVSRGQI